MRRKVSQTNSCPYNIPLDPSSLPLTEWRTAGARCGRRAAQSQQQTRPRGTTQAQPLPADYPRLRRRISCRGAPGRPPCGLAPCFRTRLRSGCSEAAQRSLNAAGGACRRTPRRRTRARNELHRGLMRGVRTCSGRTIVALWREDALRRNAASTSSRSTMPASSSAGTEACSPEGEAVDRSTGTASAPCSAMVLSSSPMLQAAPRARPSSSRRKRLPNEWPSRDCATWLGTFRPCMTAGSS